MAMEQSILKSTKKLIGLADEYTAFDLDILIYINSAFSTLRDLGIGAPGFYVEDEDATWEMVGEDAEYTPMIKTYVVLRVKVAFDPPNTSFVLDSMNKQIAEQEWRLSVNRENRDWEDPTPEPDPEELIG